MIYINYCNERVLPFGPSVRDYEEEKMKGGRSFCTSGRDFDDA